MFKTGLALAAALTLIGAASTSSAADHCSVTVSAVGLDLASVDGVAKFEHRIAEAAKTVCWPVDTSSARMSVAYRECRAAAVASAKPMADAAIAAVRDGKSGVSAAVTVSR